MSNRTAKPAWAIGLPDFTPANANDARIANQAWRDLDLLTPADRALVEAVTGLEVPSRDSGAPPLAAPLALAIVADRKTGMLDVEQAIDSVYIQGLLTKYGAAGKNGLGAELLARALEYIADNAPSRIDVNA